jgi:hypothetical protein
MKNNDGMEAVLQELAEEAMITGGAVWTFGPDGSEEHLFPPVRCSWNAVRRRCKASRRHPPR